MAKNNSEKFNNKTKLYLFLIITVGLLIITVSIYNFFSNWSSVTDVPTEIISLIILLIITSLFRSLPVYVKSDQALDMSIIAVYAMLMLKDINTVIFIFAITSFFVIEKADGGGKKYKTIFNTPLYKSLFNNANQIIAVWCGIQIYYLLGGQVGDISLPGALLPSLSAIITVYFVNTVLLSGLFSAMGVVPFKKAMNTSFANLIPNLLLTAPLGYFFATFFQMPEGGMYMSLLFFMPILLARFSFKLYLDSKDQLYRTIRTLTVAIEEKDKYTEGHSRRVEMYAERIAREMNFSENKIEQIKIASLLHDIGKIGIDDNILRKPAGLNDKEWIDIKRHPSIGVKILADVDMDKIIKDVIHYHHIHYNGNGYPQIEDHIHVPIGAFIIGVADAYDAMTSNRPYRKALSTEEALSIIEANKGGQFHPLVADAFLKTMGREN